MSIIGSSQLAAQASVQLNRLKQQASVLGTAASTQKNPISTISAANIVLDGIFNNQKSTLTGCDTATQNAVAYLQSAQASLQEQQSLVQNALSLATSAATNPGLVTQLGTLNAQFLSALAQIDAVTQNTHDAAGNAILTGVVGSFNSGANAALTEINAVAGVFNPTTAGAQTSGVNINAIRTALVGVPNIGINAGVTASLTNLANSEIALGAGKMTGANFIAGALSVIPNIQIDASQIAQKIADAVRAEQIASSLPDVLAKALAASVAQGDVTTTVIGYLTNSAIPASGTPNVLAGVNIALAHQAATAAFAALLTPGEIAALKGLVAATGRLDHVGAAASTISVADIREIVTQITCCTNLNLQAVGANGIVVDAGTAGNNVTGTAAQIGAVLGTTGACMTTIRKYVTDAAIAYVAGATAQQNIQVGLAATDTIQLKIASSTQTALGLSASTINTVANAQTASAALQKALERISSNLASINSQVDQLNSRTDTINNNIDTLAEQISSIEDTDLVANASQLGDINTAIGVVGALVQLDSTIKQTIAAASQQILRG